MSRVAESKKALWAAATALASMEGLVASLEASATHPWIHGVVVGLSAVVGGAVWLVRNKATVDQVLDAFDNDQLVKDLVTEAATDGAADARKTVDKAVAKHPKLAEEMLSDFIRDNP